jgi:hypothetical protein
VSQLGARSAIHCKARFSTEAVSAWFTRRAVRNTASSFVVTDFAFIVVSFSIAAFDPEQAFSRSLKNHALSKTPIHADVVQSAGFQGLDQTICEARCTQSAR